MSVPFKDMDELRASVASMKNCLSAEDYELLLYLSGLLENRAVSDPVQIQGKEVKIDRFLVPMVIDLNKRGIQTVASCSGLQEEHPEGRFRPESGYMSIAFDDDLFEFMQRRLNDPRIEVDASECYLKPAIRIVIRSKEDPVLKEKWGTIWAVLKQWPGCSDGAQGE